MQPVSGVFTTRAEADQALQSLGRTGIPTDRITLLSPGADVEEAFTRGYQRGREHYQQLCDQGKKAA
jgi:hypothetical protein